jgi:ABC-type nickel/cobalt efflux system permease component RcnA
MKKKRFLTLIILSIVMGHIFAPLAAAHPLGNFTINHYAGLHLSRDAIIIDYVLDMAEIPAFQEISALDANQNGQPDPVETAGYRARQCQVLEKGLHVRLNGRRLPLSLASSAVEFPAGAGGLPTLRLTCTFQAPLALTDHKANVEFKNDNYAERLGWREIVVSGEGVLLGGDLADMTHSVSQRLTVYPTDLPNNPQNQREVTFSLTPAAAPVSSTSTMPEAVPAVQPLANRNDGFTRLITADNLNPLTLALVLAIAFGWGAAHALTPGHGKTIVAAYLVGSRGTTRHALFLGLTTTLTHTAGVFILGFLTLFASEFILPEQLYPWLGVASGLLVVGLGWSLFKERFLRLVNPGVNNHSRDHRHGHGDFHHHGHSHGGHTHLPPSGDDSAVAWRNLLALGVSGGLIPCPSALVVMLSAIAIQRILFGLGLIVAFSLGLAGVLMAMGILWVRAGRLFGRIPVSGFLFQAIPVLSPLVIAIIGLGIFLQALVQTGVLPAEMAAAITLVAARAGMFF